MAVLKGSQGQGRPFVIDYRLVNGHSQGDAFVMPHLLRGLNMQNGVRGRMLFLTSGNHLMILTLSQKVF